MFVVAWNLALEGWVGISSWSVDREDGGGGGASPADDEIDVDPAFRSCLRCSFDEISLHSQINSVIIAHDLDLCRGRLDG